MSEALELRARPTQERSRRTFEHLLACAADLLQQHGASTFTTNLLAAHAGVSVRAIYRYFPNKETVFAELAARMGEQWQSAVADVGDFHDVSLPWEDLWPAYLDAFAGVVARTPGAMALLLAIRDDPALREIDDRLNVEFIHGVAEALQARNPACDAGTAVATATVLIRSAVAIFDDAFARPEADRAPLLAALKCMHLGLLRATLSGG